MLRSDYMKDPKNLHHEYYRQYAVPVVKTAVSQKFGSILLDHEYPFNTIPLAMWDALTYVIPDVLFRQCGDFPTLAGKVCALKTAARLVRAELATQQKKLL